MVEAAKSITPATSTALSVRNASKYFSLRGKPHLVLNNICLDVQDGEFLCLVGPSGCGKSTLLNMLAGLEKADQGELFHENSLIEAPSGERLMMFQDAALFPWLDVLGNVLFSLRLSDHVPKDKRLEVALHYLRLVGLNRFRRSFVHELSGGMRQRAALARALAPNPKILLMDEPFAALDAMTREQLYQDLQDIWIQQRKTIVLVTHNIREAVCLGDRVVLINGSPGELKEEFQIDLPRPRDINSATLANYAARITRALKGQPLLFEGI